jgi:hypothetical protein
MKNLRVPGHTLSLVDSEKWNDIHLLQDFLRTLSSWKLRPEMLRIPFPYSAATAIFVYNLELAALQETG